MTAKRIGMVIAVARQLHHVWLQVPLILMVAILATGAYANQTPVADAGPSRYAGDEPIEIDGTRSYDPDPGDTLTYQWTQVSGPSVILSDTDTATPTAQRNTDGTVQKVVLSLTVTDNQQAISSDTVEVTIVPGISNFNTMSLENDTCGIQPFDPNKPTYVRLSGGNCYRGGGHWNCSVPDEGGSAHLWRSYANVITFTYWPDCEWDVSLSCYPLSYNRCGDQLIVYLSKVAPNYDQPIEIAGGSTGGMPAIGMAIWMNTQYKDPRYNVTLVTLPDAACWDYLPYIDTFSSSSVNGEPAWVLNCYASEGIASYRSGAVNVCMHTNHRDSWWWHHFSIQDAFLTDTYNHGVVAGPFIGVVGPGRNYNVPQEATGYYYFNWHRIEDINSFTYYDRANYPGALPEPVTLLGPPDSATLLAYGTTLGSQASEHAVLYQLLMGEDKHNLSVVLEEDTPFEIDTGALPPDKVFFWTVKIHDQYGTTIHADPRYFKTPPSLAADLNNDATVDQADCALMKSAIYTSLGHSRFAMSADLNGDGMVTCLDAEEWLVLYRDLLQDSNAPDPCGLENTADADGDGTRDLCDNCPSVANSMQEDVDGDGVGDICDNCPQRPNNNQLDTDIDGAGNMCDDDNDNDGLLDRNDNCPNTANPDRADSDSDGVGDACDNCPNLVNPKQLDTDGDGAGNDCDSDMDNDGILNEEDNCPMNFNPDQGDSDGDNISDACDNCPAVANVDQADIDEDERGDICDDDDDNDGLPDTNDNCPAIANQNQENTDSDAEGDVCDNDDDNDGVLDIDDNCRAVVNPNQANADGDFKGDACDLCTDTDGDGFGNPGYPLNECMEDNCPTKPNGLIYGTCIAGKMTTKACTYDWDCDSTSGSGDGVCSKYQEDADDDLIGDVCDNCSTVVNTDQADVDSDRVGDVCDNCPSVKNPTQHDMDGDGVGDVCDDDRDGDGFLNTDDNCPTVPNPDQADEDNDGVGDECDECPGTMAGLAVDSNGCMLPIPGDFNADGDVDQQDFGQFQLCYDCTFVLFCPGCDTADLDDDNDVDLADLDIFQVCVSGPTVMGDAYCAD